MIPMADDTVTIYMKHVADHKDVWKRAVISGVVWSQKTVRAIASDGTLSLVRQTVVKIPAEAVVEVNDVQVAYVAPKSYAGTGWTLKAGFVLIRGTGAAITDSYTIASLKKDNDTYSTIQVVRDNTQSPMLRHWKVEAV